MIISISGSQYFIERGFFTVDELAEELETTTATVRAGIRTGIIPHIRGPSGAPLNPERFRRALAVSPSIIGGDTVKLQRVKIRIPRSKKSKGSQKPIMNVLPEHCDKAVDKPLISILAKILSEERKTPV